MKTVKRAKKLARALGEKLEAITRPPAIRVGAADVIDLALEDAQGWKASANRERLRALGMEGELQRYREAVEWYANDGNWVGLHDGLRSPAEEDGGSLARRTLAP